MGQDKFTYVNCRGDVYYLRSGKSGRGGGTLIICSKKCTPDALEAIPEGMEIAESPNGKVSCRKKQQSAILPQERDGHRSRPVPLRKMPYKHTGKNKNRGKPAAVPRQKGKTLWTFWTSASASSAMS